MDDLRKGKLLDRYLYATAASLAIIVLITAFCQARWPLYAWAIFAFPLAVLAVVQSTRFIVELGILAIVTFFKWIVRRLWRLFRIGPEPFAPPIPPPHPPAPLTRTPERKPHRAAHDHPVI